MERYKNPILAIISVVVFWLLAIASSPQIGLTVDCEKLPSPTTKTFTVTIAVMDLETDQPLKATNVLIEQRNIAAVAASGTDCKMEMISSSSNLKNTGEGSTAVFTVTETKKSPYDYAQVFFTVNKPGYNEGTWSFSTLTTESTTFTKTIFLTPKEIYP